MYAVILALVLVAFVVGAKTAQAAEDCLRSGDGTCVEIARHAAMGGEGNPLYQLGDSISNSAFRMSDGTMVVAAAEYKTNFSGIIFRYEIQLYTSIDNGLTWKKPTIQNKGKWYVDEVREGGVECPSFNCDDPRLDPTDQFTGAYFGAGFLGYSVSHYDTTDATYIGIAHTSACGVNRNPGETLVFNDPFGDFGSEYNCDSSVSFGGNHSGGATFFDFIVYSSEDKSFIQPVIGVQSNPANTPTRSLTQTHTTRPISSQTCHDGPCFGSFKGTMHPSLTLGVASSGTVKAAVSYYAYRGDACQGGGNGECTDQNDQNNYSGSDGSLWVRHFDIDIATGAITSSDAQNRMIENYQFNSDTSGQYRWLDERHAIYSKLITTWSTVPMSGTPSFSPLLLYGYSKPNSVAEIGGQSISKLKWSAWNNTTSTWDAKGFVEDVANVWRGDGDQSSIDKELLAAFDGSNGTLDTPITVVPTLASVASPESSYSGIFEQTVNPRQHRVVHVSTIADLGIASDANNLYSASPVYLRFYSPSAGSWNDPQGLLLADKSQPTEPMAYDAEQAGNPYVRPYFYHGGPSIQYATSELFIAVPAAPHPFDTNSTKQTDLYYTRIQEPPAYAEDYIGWATDVTELWLDNADGDKGTSSVPVWSQMTKANAFVSGGLEPAFAAPHLFDYNIKVDIQVAARTNLFLPSMVFVRATYGATPEQCHNGTPCGVHFSGEQNTHAIRGWAWAEVVGWLSLSCQNLNSCNKKSEPWSSKVGGTYYGVRTVVSNSIAKNTLIGRAWSERVGFVSFSREDAVTDSNPCGNPPGTELGDEYYRTSPYCGKISGNISDGSGSIQINKNTFPAGPGYVLVGTEVMRYTGTTPAGSDMILTGLQRGASLANEVYITTIQNHSAGTPIFNLGSQDPTAAASGSDVYVALNSYNPETFELKGWARALAWKEYQETYCGTDIGPSFPAPCDKEWGWIKLEGDWETVSRGNFNATSSCGQLPNDPLGDNVYLDSVDGYPDPGGGNEFIQLGAMVNGAFVNNPQFFSYSGIDTVNKRLTGVRDVLSSPQVTNPIENRGIGASCTSKNGNSVPWVSQLSTSIDASDQTISIQSADGFLPFGEAEILADEGLDGIVEKIETIEYTQIDTSVSPPQLQYVMRGASGTTALDFPVPERTFIRPIQDSGTYGTFVLELTDQAPEDTMLGFGWSAPTTESLTPDPFASRYENSLAGFGWLNFQPNRLELIYPFLRTLFSDVYIGGNYTIVGPESTKVDQYTSTYLLQGNGVVLPFLSGRDATSRAYTECTKDNTLEFCAPLSPVTEAPDIAINPGELSYFGRLPSHDDLTTWVRGCRDKDGNLINGTGECPEKEDQARFIDSFQDQASFMSEFTGAGLSAVSGINRFGHHVILCRNIPFEATSVDINTPAIFRPNGWSENPVECEWTNSVAWEGELAVEYDPSISGTKLCVTNASGATIDTSESIQIGSETIDFDIAGVNTCGGSATEITLDDPLVGTYSAGDVVVGADPKPFKKVRKSPLGLPTIYTFPNDYGPSGEIVTSVDFDKMPIQFNNGDNYYDWDVDGNGLLDDLLPGGIVENGSVTIASPTSIFFGDSHIRYCPTGIPSVPCLSESDTENSLSDIRQLASVGWYVDGFVGSLFGFGNFYPSEPKGYLAGSFLVYGENEADRYCPEGVPGPCENGYNYYFNEGSFISHWYVSTGVQLNIHGLVIARNFTLVGDYFIQGENEAVVEPAENFVYDGRVVANPPPGFEDISSGLPTISQATP